MKTDPSAAPLRRDQDFASFDGYVMVGLALLLVALGVAVGVIQDPFRPALILATFALVGVAVIIAAGLYMLQPNQAAVLTLFGRYVGTDRKEGLRWAMPLYRKRQLSLRARNLNMPTLKVNDKRGNPIEISAAVVWRVRDCAQALFEVDDYDQFVHVQAETALRHLASLYAYDDGEDLAAGETTLRAGMDDVSQALRAELQARFADAGVAVIDAKLTHLAYASEIAQVMLRRQQAEAIVSARQRIVHGAVSMVEMALKGLAERGIVELDAERKAAMVSNLLVVLCSDKDTQPVVNAGTLYH